MLQSHKSPWLTMRRLLLLLAVLLVAGCSSKEQRAESHYERGIKFVAQHDDVKASIEFRNALQLDKNMVKAWRGLAGIEKRNKNWGSLIGIRRTIVQLAPNDVDAKLRLARLLFIAKDMDGSLKLVNAATKLDKRNTTALGLKAMILYRRNQNDDRKTALSTAQAALAINPADVEATVVLAADRFLHNDTKGALEILDRHAGAHEKDVGIQLFKLKILERMKNLKQVEAVLLKLVEHYPKQSGFRKALVKLYLYEKRPQDAEKELRALAAANPNDPAVEMDVVRLLRKTKGPAAAREELEARIKAGGQVSDYQIALAQLDFAQGDVHKSVSLLENLGNNTDSSETAVLAKVKLAELYFARKKFDEANALVSQVLQKDSRNAGALKVRAEIHLAHGQLDAAIADLREALNDNPRSTRLILLLAGAYERSGSIDLAEKQYVAAMRITNGNAAIGLEYVAFLQRRGNPQHADDILAQLAKRYPGNIKILSTLARLRLKQKNWTEAKKIADNIRRIGNDNGLADRILAAALSGQNKYNESISILEKAYTAAPSVTRMVALVNEFMRAKQFDKAEAFLKDILKSDSSNGDAYVMLGAVQLRQNASDQALKSFQAAIAQKPKDANGYNVLADLYIREKKSDEALKTIRAGLRVQPNSLALHMTLAAVLIQTGDYEGAIAEYDSLLKQHPASMVIANNLASLLSEHRTDKASLDRAYAIAAILRKSPVARFEDTVGWIEYQRGDYRSAVSLLEAAATRRRNVGLLRYHLGMSYIATDQLAKASEQLKTALELTQKGDALEQKIRAGQRKLAVANWKKNQQGKEN